jgi:tRNA(Arg) A34 adenosine deaminase TadA
MLSAIKKTKEGIKNKQAPFGACIVKNNKIISCKHNTVWKDKNIIKHAEINAIEDACKKLKTIKLTGCIIYSTCEPCPLCFSACHWVNIKEIIYGASIKDAKKLGFHELTISNKKMKILGKSKIKLTNGFMKKECNELFRNWKNKKVY